MRQDENKERLGNELRQAIKDAEISQARVAKRLDVHPSTLSKWLSGLNPIRRDSLVAICHLLKLGSDRQIKLFELTPYSLPPDLQKELLRQSPLNLSPDRATGTLTYLGELIAVPELPLHFLQRFDDIEELKKSC
jgi:transcriptional regulator with XRE-family HTH domain